jgi:hypothetical protein
MKRLLSFLLLSLLLTASLFLVKGIVPNKVLAACGDSNYPRCRRGSCGSGQTCRQGTINHEWTCKCIRDHDNGGPTSTPVPTPEPYRGPIPPPYVPCNEVRYPEFHSLRPYQASPCNQKLEDLALYCGDSITIEDDIDVTYNYYSPPPDCAEGEIDRKFGIDCCYRDYEYEGVDYCRFYIHREREIAIDLSDAELPIMGNTEDVINSQDQNLASPSVAETGTFYCDNNAMSGGCINNCKQGYFPNCTPGDVTGYVPCLGPYSPTACISAGPVERITNEQKVNEYVSWYLNGINERAEYSFLNPEDPADQYKLINLSGPLKKLLSFASQQWIRTDEVMDAYQSRIWSGQKTGSCTANSTGTACECSCPSGTHPISECLGDVPVCTTKSCSCEVDNAQGSPIRHDQYVACVFSITLPIIGEVGHISKPCYEGIQVQQLHRLTDWFWRNPLTHILVRDNLPPDPSDSQYDNNYLQYWVDYKEWRGEWCQIIPIFGGHRFFYCFDGPQFNVTYWWSNLFTYIPFSSTEDRLGESELTTFTIQPPHSSEFEITYAALLNQSPAKLYFAHMQETEELGEILQQTYAPKDAELPGEASLTYVSAQPYCDLKEVRSNPGDNLFAGEITATLVYDAILHVNFYNGQSENGIWCETAATPERPPNGSGLGGTCVPSGSRRYCDTYYPRIDCPQGTLCSVGCVDYVPVGYQCSFQTDGYGNCFPDNWDCAANLGPDYDCYGPYDCTGQCTRPAERIPDQTHTIPVLVTMDTVTKTPLIDSIWARLVAGPMGTFKRFFPQVTDDRTVPVKAIWDIPGATAVKYTGEGIVHIGTPWASRPYPELYFPHIGGLHEYFLHGIQTALRPKGYGYPILSGPNISPGITGGTPGVCGYFEKPAPESPYPSDTGYCQTMAAGWCSVSSLRRIANQNGYNLTDQELRNASMICNLESGGWSNAFNDGCMCGRSVDFSIGLFQINQLPRNICPGAFEYFTWTPPSCPIANEDVLRQCMDFYFDPVNNITEALGRMSRGLWCDWKTASIACGVVASCP